VDDLIDGFHYVAPYLIEVLELADPLMQLCIVSVDAVVHDPIQIEIEVVYNIFMLVN